MCFSSITVFLPATKCFLLFLLSPSSWLLEESITLLYMLSSVGWKKNYGFSECPPMWLGDEGAGDGTGFGGQFRQLIHSPNIDWAPLWPRPMARPWESSGEKGAAHAFKEITVICRSCAAAVCFGPPHTSLI